jgi:hypothetical protein
MVKGPLANLGKRFDSCYRFGMVLDRLNPSFERNRRRDNFK